MDRFCPPSPGLFVPPGFKPGEVRMLFLPFLEDPRSAPEADDCSSARNTVPAATKFFIFSPVCPTQYQGTFLCLFSLLTSLQVCLLRVILFLLFTVSGPW